MASLFRKPRSPFWFAAYRDAQGRRRQKTTKTNVRKKALEMALQFEKLAEKGRQGVLTDAIARSVVSELVQQATGEALHFATCRSWFSEWLAGKKGTASDGTLTKYGQVIEDFLEHLGQRSELPLASISPKDVRSFRDALAAGGRAPSTVNQAIKKSLAVPFVAAQRIGYITVNPCAAVESLRDEGKASRETFTVVQVQKLLAVADDEWKGAILMGFFTGLRLRDITGMRWETVDFAESVLRLKTGKTSAEILIPIHEELAAWLHSQTRGIGKAPIFPALVSKGTGGRHGLSGRFTSLMEQAGISGKVIRSRAEAGAGRTTRSLSFHSLRHSFVSALANAGVSSELRQKLSGHADAKSHAIYSHHEIESLRAAVAKVPSLGA